MVLENVGHGLGISGIGLCPIHAGFAGQCLSHAGVGIHLVQILGISMSAIFLCRTPFVLLTQTPGFVKKEQ